MVYEPIHDRIVPSMIFYIVLCVFSIFMTIKMYKKYKERKVRPPLLMTLIFLTFTVALLSLTVGLIETVITGYFMEIYRISLPFAYSSIIVADILLYLFSKDITDKDPKALIPLIIIGTIIIIVLALPFNWWGFPSEAYEGKLNIRTYSTISMVIYSYAVFLNIAIIIHKTKREAPNNIARVGLSLFFNSIICLMLFFAMIIGDTLLIIIFDHVGYSEFIYIAWIFAVMFYIFTYMSLVMPNWLKQRIKE